MASPWRRPPSLSPSEDRSPTPTHGVLTCHYGWVVWRGQIRHLGVQAERGHHAGHAWVLHIQSLWAAPSGSTSFLNTSPASLASLPPVLRSSQNDSAGRWDGPRSMQSLMAFSMFRPPHASFTITSPWSIFPSDTSEWNAPSLDALYACPFLSAPWCQRRHCTGVRKWKAREGAWRDGWYCPPLRQSRVQSALGALCRSQNQFNK